MLDTVSTRGAKEAEERMWRDAKTSDDPDSRAGKLFLILLTELIPRVALFDGPEHGFFQFLQCHVVRVADGL